MVYETCFGPCSIRRSLSSITKGNGARQLKARLPDTLIGMKIALFKAVLSEWPKSGLV